MYDVYVFNSPSAVLRQPSCYWLRNCHICSFSLWVATLYITSSGWYVRTDTRSPLVLRVGVPVIPPITF